MPYKLEDYKPKDDSLTYGDMTLILTADIPRSVLKVYEGIEDERDPEKIMDITLKWIEGSLLVKNPPALVTKFLALIKDSTSMINGTATIISEHITNALEKKKT